MNTNLEELDDAVPDQQQAAGFRCPGRYEFNEYFIFWNSNARRAFSFTAATRFGTFYDGYKHNYSGGSSLRLNAHLNASLNVQINVIYALDGRLSRRPDHRPRQLSTSRHGCS